MKNSYTFAMIAIPVALVVFLLSPVLWPEPEHNELVPTAAQLPFFIILGGIEALAFGVGVALLVRGWPLARRLAGESRKAAVSCLLAITWLLVSWWPHDNMHRVNGDDTGGLLQIEYMFHFTLIVAASVLAYYLFQWLKKESLTA